MHIQSVHETTKAGKHCLHIAYVFISLRFILT